MMSGAAPSHTSNIFRSVAIYRVGEAAYEAGPTR